MADRRPYWKGFLKLSLVTCPVALYPASSQSEKTRFHQINRKTGNRLRQQMIDEVTGNVVDREDKTRGYEVDDGQYVEIAREDIDSIAIESTHTIGIESFVPADEIDKRYYEKPYYIAPNGNSGEEAFAVIRDAMKNKGRVALAKIVLAGREHVMAIEPWGKGLLGTTLRYDYEVRDDKDVFDDVPSPRVPKEMVQLASHILDSMGGKFEPAKFKDDYELALRALVKRKAEGKPIRRAEQRAESSNVVDLMAALRQSLKGKGGGEERPRAAAHAAYSPSRKSKKAKPATRARKAS
jgi:Ku protein